MMWEKGVLSGGIGITVLAAGIFLTAAPQRLEAQLRTQERGRVSLEARAGIAVPVGELDDIADVGPSFGGGVAYFFHPNIGVMADVQVSLLSASSLDPFNVIRTSDVNLTLHPRFRYRGLLPRAEAGRAAGSGHQPPGDDRDPGQAAVGRRIGRLAAC